MPCSLTKLIFAVLAIPLFLAPAQGQDTAKPLVIWDFDRSLVNPLGGRYSVFLSAPSWARTYLEPEASGEKAGHSLRISAHRETNGFCGVWFNFYSAREVPEKYLDASGYRFLSFQVRGEKGGEDFNITLEDATWHLHEDANPTRPLSAYLPGGASTSWRQVEIPLGDFAGLDSSRLFNLTFVFSKAGDSRLEVDNIALSNGSGIPLAAPPSPAPAARADADPIPGRGLWVWNTSDLTDPSNADQLDSFLGFSAAHHINQIFLSVEFQKPAAGAAPQLTLKNPEGLRTFLSRAHAQGMKVEALAGTPEWAAREHHAEALAVIDSVAAFNQEGSAVARFDGIHFDVEPYSLVGYADPAFRPHLLKQFLELMEECKDRAHSDGGLTFSCDVPAWFYTDNPAARLELLVDFHGTTKMVGEHLTDLLDSVTIMDYRNEADGAGGIILSGVPSLKYAAARGKKIQVGLETSLEPDRTIYFVCGLPLVEFQKRLSNSRLRNELYKERYRLATLSDGTNIHIGLTAPEPLDDTNRGDFEAAFVKLAHELGASSNPEMYPPDKILPKARAALRTDPELSGFETFRLADPKTKRDVVGFKAVRHMLPAITFHGLSRDVFDEETRSAAEWL
ncbi:MAG: hypothetical protein ACM3NO_10395, partial [Deltaproteobacteria bacterium]